MWSADAELKSPTRQLHLLTGTRGLAIPASACPNDYHLDDLVYIQRITSVSYAGKVAAAAFTIIVDAVS